MASWSMSDRSREAHQRWSCLEAEEKDRWKSQAKELNTCEPEELPANAKKRIIHASLRRLSAEVYRDAGEGGVREQAPLLPFLRGLGDQICPSLTAFILY